MARRVSPAERLAIHAMRAGQPRLMTSTYRTIVGERPGLRAVPADIHADQGEFDRIDARTHRYYAAVDDRFVRRLQREASK